MNGKGDKRRPELIQGAYRKNYDRIFRHTTNMVGQNNQIDKKIKKSFKETTNAS